MFDISIRHDLDKLQKKLTGVASRQLQFASARTLTTLAQQTAAEEQKNMAKVLDRPTPFTVKSVKVRAARKDGLYATVFIQDKAAAYLEPYEFGGTNKLNSKALIKPVNLKLNQYGNLPKAKLKQLKERADIYIGKIKTKSGEVDGVWQRLKPTKGKPGGLKLLIRFADAHPVRQHLGYFSLAEKIVRKNFRQVMGRELAKAISSAK